LTDKHSITQSTGLQQTWNSCKFTAIWTPYYLRTNLE
jgi:hypothetical protein